MESKAVNMQVAQNFFRSSRDGARHGIQSRTSIFHDVSALLDDLPSGNTPPAPVGRQELLHFRLRRKAQRSVGITSMNIMRFMSTTEFNVQHEKILRLRACGRCLASLEGYRC